MRTISPVRVEHNPVWGNIRDKYGEASPAPVKWRTSPSAKSYGQDLIEKAIDITITEVGPVEARRAQFDPGRWGHPAGEEGRGQGNEDIIR